MGYMPDDVANLLLTQMGALDEKVDRISDRLARIETKVAGREKVWNAASGWVAGLSALVAVLWTVVITVNGGKL